MATLQLNLIKQWFNLTLQGIKKEEYRDITPYWAKRFLCMENGESLTKCYSNSVIKGICNTLKDLEALGYNSFEHVLLTFHIRFKEFETTDFRNGYKALNKVPRFIIENKGTKIGIGKEEWGFIRETPKFIVIHGKIIEKFNIE